MIHLVIYIIVYLICIKTKQNNLIQQKNFKKMAPRTYVSEKQDTQLRNILICIVVAVFLIFVAIILASVVYTKNPTKCFDPKNNITLNRSRRDTKIVSKDVIHNTQCICSNRGISSAIDKMFKKILDQMLDFNNDQRRYFFLTLKNVSANFRENFFYTLEKTNKLKPTTIFNRFTPPNKVGQTIPLKTRGYFAPF